jgi:hypothetical protein
MGNVADVVPLHLREVATVDPARLAALQRRMGEEGAQLLLHTTLEDLAAHLSRAAAAYDARHWERMAQACRNVADAARAVGLDRLGRVARTTAMLSGRTGDVALAANTARLMRLGEGALAALWDLREAGQ